MSSDWDRDRPISGQRLPIGLGAPRPRAFPDAARPAAAFLAHLLSTRPNIVAPDTGTRAECAYRRAETSDIKRLPPGVRRNLSA